MRILSNFKDYYDVGMSLGQDQALLYKRYEKEVVPPQYPFLQGPQDHFTYYGHNYNLHTLLLDTYTIGFCGKIYYALEINLTGIENHRLFCYTLADIDKFVKKALPAHWQDYNSTGRGHNLKWPAYQRRSRLKEFFVKASQDAKKKEHQQWFDKERCPIFVAHATYAWQKRDKIITYNSCLKDFEFFRIYNPYDAFQEIAMWLGNQAEPRKPVPPISDEVLAESKGFDKFSFRKDKKKK